MTVVCLYLFEVGLHDLVVECFDVIFVGLAEQGELLFDGYQVAMGCFGAYFCLEFVLFETLLHSCIFLTIGLL